MKTIGYYWAKLVSKVKKNHEIEVNYYRKRWGVNIGKRCLICTNLCNEDFRLLEIGDDVVISTNVSFVIHDFSISRVIPGKSNLYGKIVIGNNCFIGDSSVIMYGVELGENIIVAAGSVVTKSFNEQGIIIGGNPARKIGNWDTYKLKYEKNATNVGEYINSVLEQKDRLVIR